MITVKVSYGIKEAFVAKNKENIATFIKDFEAINDGDFKYDVYIQEDNTSFIHLSSYANEAIQKKVLSTPSFVEFQRQRDESGLTKAHHIVTLQHFATSDAT